MNKMHYNKKKIMKLVDKYVDFGNGEDDFTSETYAINNFNELAKKFWVKSGATKLVLIPKQGDYVIKIPFFGEMFEGEFWDEEEQDYSYSSEFKDFSNAPYRRPTSPCYNDYCWCEVEIYKQAKEYGVEDFFAETRLIGKTFPTNHPVYVQERLPEESFFKYNRLQESEVEYTKSKISATHPCCGVSSFFLTEVRLHNKFSTFDKLIKFITEYEIDDVHENNWGYRNGKAIILDYSGFYEE